MFLLVSVRHVGAHPGEHQHGVSIQISISLGKTFLRISRIRNIPLTWILARVFVYVPPFISQILDFIYWTVLIFIWSILNGVTLKTSNSDCGVIVASLKQNTAGKKERDPTTKKTKITFLLLVVRGGGLPIMPYTGRLRPKGVPFSGFRVYHNLRSGFH